MNNSKILIVEDNEDLSFTLSNVLKKEGYKIMLIIPDKHWRKGYNCGNTVDVYTGFFKNRAIEH